MKKISLLTCSAALLWPLSLSAQTCTTPPSCDTLGYKQAASDCSGQQMLKCPFDNSKVFCGGAACSEDYALTSCDTSAGTCDECGGKYKYTKCNSGWTLSGGNCSANDCSEYTLSSCPANSYCGSCKSGTDSLKYKFSSCNFRYCWNGSYCYYCYDSNCTNAGYSESTPNSLVLTYETCIGSSSGKTYYKALTCEQPYQPGDCYPRGSQCQCNNEA